MTSATTEVCRSCGGAILDTPFCETCGAEQQTDLAVSTATTPASALTRLRIVTAAGVLLVMVVPSIATTIAYAVSDYGLIGPRIFTVLLIVGTSVAAILAARLDRATPGARRGAVVLVSIIGGLAAIAGAISPSYATVFWIFPIAVFISWAISARFRGLGYWGLAIGLGTVILENLASATVFSFRYSPGGTAIYEIIAVVLAAVVIATAVGSAIGFERIHARRPVRERPVPTQYVAGTASQPMSGATDAGYYSEHTNGLAVATLVLGILGGTVITIVLGHVALSQIRRTGERGSGMAIAGLILGYAWTAAAIILLIIYITVWSTALQALSHPYDY